MKITIGSDPGLDGGYAVVGGGKVLEIAPNPIIKVGRKKVFDDNEMSKILRGLKEKGDVHVYIEQVASRPLQGAPATFTFGMGYGMLRGICSGAMIPYTLVTPKKWKRKMLSGLDGTKKASSIIRAKQIIPTINLKATPRCRKDHDGMAEGLLIALYGENISKL